MSRIVVLELLQALKFKSPLPDTNLLLLVQVKVIWAHFKVCISQMCDGVSCVSQFVCADIGTRLAESTIIQKHMISTLPGVRR